ncbi:hypothetical protein OQA88_7748 [Cercophora sp. LCS_1]
MEMDPTSLDSEGDGDHERASELHVDPDFINLTVDNDSALGSDVSFSTEPSLHDSVLRFREIHGRTYHNYKNAEYWGPNDGVQNDALEFHHHMMVLLHEGKLFRAPVENPQAVLDVGTGTGIWAVEVAEKFPSAEVIGTDLSPIQPVWCPPNCRFELDDVTKPWVYQDNSFDFIHIRCMLGSVGDWTELYREAYRCLKPGGWLEHTDFTIHITSDDNSIPENSVYHEWGRVFDQGGERMGRTFRVAEDGQMAAGMREAGFAGAVHIKDFKLPLGMWPVDKKWKEVGAFNVVSCDYGVEGYLLYTATKVLGWTIDEVQDVVDRMRLAMRKPAWHAYYPCSTVWTMKPI